MSALFCWFIMEPDTSTTDTGLFIDDRTSAIILWLSISNTLFQYCESDLELPDSRLEFSIPSLNLSFLSLKLGILGLKLANALSQ
ncbi:hypothetical protein RirG_223210 [Rhizophagus irregularis DAOM 197198w]|uniref:Uncharacterized protein n=1 Tax=Rhizophagus irregularis (strain DAOM 197198w) TaxID=1432141 RepID=A0A015JL86_RHIIW|nr:hypothetical protein RirG_223210 [Rhizophagus irregularis DAOM 197198w]